jgi:NAD+ kinase
LLQHDAEVRFTVLEPEKRPVNAAADSFEVENIVQVEVRKDRTTHIRLLFDPGQSLEDRITREQFIS